MIQGAYLFYYQGRNIPLQQVVNSSIERERILQAMHEKSDH